MKVIFSSGSQLKKQSDIPSWILDLINEGVLSSECYFKTAHCFWQASLKKQ